MKRIDKLATVTKVAKGKAITGKAVARKVAGKLAKVSKVAKGKVARKAKAAAEYTPKLGTGLEFAPTDKLRVLVTENPKRGASAVRFGKAYLGKRRPTTVQQALDNGATLADIRWDHGHRHIEVSGKGVVASEYMASK